MFLLSVCLTNLFDIFFTETLTVIINQNDIFHPKSFELWKIQQISQSHFSKFFANIFSRIFSSQSHYTITIKNYITECRRTCSKLFEEKVILWFWDLNFTFCHSISIFEHTAHLRYTQQILILLFTMYVMYIYIYLYLQYMNNNSYQYSNGINHLLFTY